MTMIDPATRWIEIHKIHRIDSLETARALDIHWLCRYPRPIKCIHDNGKEFTGKEFQELLQSYAVKSTPTTVRNPQANSILERVHGVIHTTTRAQTLKMTLEHGAEPDFDQILATCAFAVRSTYHTTLNYTPDQTIYGRDMILPTKINIDWNAIRLRKEQQIQKDNNRENATRKPHTYNVGDYVIIRNDSIRDPKHNRRAYGQYPIVQVRNNGTLVIEKGNYFETVNIRRVAPYHGGEFHD